MPPPPGRAAPKRPPPSRPPPARTDSARSSLNSALNERLSNTGDALAFLSSVGSLGSVTSQGQSNVHFGGVAESPKAMHSPSTSKGSSDIQGVLRKTNETKSGSFRVPTFDGITGTSSRELQTKYETEKMRREQLEKQNEKLQDDIEEAHKQLAQMQGTLDEHIASKIHLRTRMAVQIEVLTSKYAREIKRNRRMAKRLTDAQLSVVDDEEEDDDEYYFSSDDELVAAREEAEIAEEEEASANSRTSSDFNSIHSGRASRPNTETIEEKRARFGSANINDMSFFTVPDPMDTLEEEHDSGGEEAEEEAENEAEEEAEVEEEAEEEAESDDDEDEWNTDKMTRRARANTGGRNLLGRTFSDDDEDEKEEAKEEEAKEEATEEPQEEAKEEEAKEGEAKEEQPKIEQDQDDSIEEIGLVLGKWSMTYGLEPTHLKYLMEELNDNWHVWEPADREEHLQEMENQIINGKYFLIEPIAKGGFGEVFMAEKRPSKELIAVKVVDLEEADDDIMTISNEIALMRGKSCPQLINYVGSEVHHTKLWIAMEYVDGGTADSMAQVEPRILTEKHIAIIAREVVLGLRYLNTQSGGSFIHRDIKGANILLGSDGQVKLADFGASKSLTETVAQAQTFVGSPYWMAPEVMNGKYDNKADIWGIGITCIELATGMPPHSEIAPLRVMDTIYNSPPPRLEGSWSQTFKDFVSECLVKDPRNRPGLRDLLRSPFIKKALPNKKLMELWRK